MTLITAFFRSSPSADIGKPCRQKGRESCEKTSGPRGGRAVSGGSPRRPGKVEGWAYARLAGQRVRAEAPRGLPGRRAGGVTLAPQGRASERRLLAASREGGRAALRSPRRAARVGGGASSRRLGRGGGGTYARLAGQRVVERGGGGPSSRASAGRPRSLLVSPAFFPCPSADRVESRAVPGEEWEVYE